MTGEATTTIGVVGQRWRAAVSPAGTVTVDAPVGDGQPLRWYVAADDRWHRPEVERSTRQQRLDGTPVLETRVRVPDGDVVQHVWAVADHGGAVVVEFTNESPLPVAIAVSGSAVHLPRTANVSVPQGIALPPDAVTLPLGHRASTRIAVCATPPADVGRLPAATSVVRGWQGITDAAGTLRLPDDRLVASVRAARADLLLAGPVDSAADPAGFLLDVAELVRLGEPADPWVPLLVEPAERVAREPGDDGVRSLIAVGRVALAAGDDRAATDAERILGRLVTTDGAGREAARSFADLHRGPSVGRFVARLESLLVDGGALLPSGLPSTWHGADFEVLDLPTGVRSSVGFALRWHGARPAILWEQRGVALELSSPTLAPSWHTSDVSGEALWPAPRSGGRRLSVSTSDS